MNLEALATSGAVAPSSVPQGTITRDGSSLGLAFPALPLIQPVADVPAYLAARRPVMDCHEEEPLLITLPEAVRTETRLLCSACRMIREKSRVASVQSACRGVIQIFCGRWKLPTLRGLYDKWLRAKDWIVLVNRAKAGAAWVERDFGLPDAFLDFVASRCGEFRRGDALPEAVRSIHRQWRTGLNHRGEAQAVPGYDWANRRREILPNGWTIGNLRTQLKRRAKYLKSHKALLHEGIAAARKFVPQVLSTREGLRFMEEVQFDDVKCDFRVFDTATGKPVDLWLLVAHDRATAMLLGFGMRPATVREDGSQEHLKLTDMKQLTGWMFERYGLPPYPMTLKVENGTATYTDATAAAIEEMLPGRLKIAFAQMIGGRSASGYLERALGNSKGKASLESHNRQMHMIGASLPGQTGLNYGLRPKDLAARERECMTIWRAAQEMPDGLRERLVNEFGYPLLTLPQARKELVRIFNIRNSRTDHSLEGFEQILENAGGRIVRRMESPAERAARLREGLKFDAVSPEIITAFYEHTQRTVTVTDAGEIEFSHENRKLTFAPVQPDAAARCPGRKLLAYFHPDDPRYLHLTTGRGELVGTWLRRALVKNGDRAALSEAIHYSAAVLAAAKEQAAHLNREEMERLETMRAKNNQLIQANTFVDVTAARPCGLDNAISHPIASGLSILQQQKKQEQKRAIQHDDDERIAREALG